MSKENDLMKAAKAGELDKVKALLGDGADVNHQDNDTFTALMHAAYEGHTEMVETFLEAGADIFYASPEGRTALNLAAHKGHTETVALLLNRGASIYSALGISQKKHRDKEVNTVINRHMFLKDLAAMVQADAKVDAQQAQKLNERINDFTAKELSDTLRHIFLGPNVRELYGDETNLITKIRDASEQLPKQSSAAKMFPPPNKLSILAEQCDKRINKTTGKPLDRDPDIGNPPMGIGNKDL